MLDRYTREEILNALRAGKTNAWIITNVGTCRATISKLVKRFKIVRHCGPAKMSHHKDKRPVVGLFPPCTAGRHDRCAHKVYLAGYPSFRCYCRCHKDPKVSRKESDYE